MTYVQSYELAGSTIVGLWRPPESSTRVALLLGRTPAEWQAADPSGQPRHLADTGWTVVAVNTPNWGNSTDLASIDTALARAAAQHPDVDVDRVLLVAYRHGAVAALNWALRHPDRVAAMSLQSPTIDLAERWTRVTADRASLEAAYGGSTSTFNTAMPTWNPAHLHRQYLTRGLLADRLTVWSSPADTDTPPAVTQTLTAVYLCATGALDVADPALASPTVLDDSATTALSWDQRPARTREAGWRQWMTDSPTSQGYKGGDAIRSTVLADGSEFYSTADNFIGAIDSDGTYSGTPLPRRNGFVLVSTAGVFSQAYGPAGALPLPPQGDPWYWPVCSILENGVLRIAAWQVTAGGIFGHLQDTVIYSLDPTVLPTVTITGTLACGHTDETTMVAYMLVDGAWIYVLCQEYVGGYDSYSSSSLTRTRLARVPYGSLTTLAAWEWWDGDRWSSTRTDAAVLTSAGQPLNGDTCLRRTRTGFVLAVMQPTETQIRLYRAGWPQGPWTLYDTVAVPALGATRYGATGVGYHPAWHPHLDPSADELMLSWNGNNFGAGSSPISDIDPDFFGPHHLVVPAPPFDL